MMTPDSWARGADVAQLGHRLKGGPEHLVVLRHIRCGHGFVVLLSDEFTVRSIMVGSGQPFHMLSAARESEGYTGGVRHDP